MYLEIYFEKKKFKENLRKRIYKSNCISLNYSNYRLKNQYYHFF